MMTCPDVYHQLYAGSHEDADERRRRNLFKLGNEFEETVISMFDWSGFYLISRSPRYDGQTNWYEHDMECPDLHFMEPSTGRGFWVECKYRSFVNYDLSIDLCTRRQLAKYRETMICTREPVLFMIGLGGDARRPECMYCLDLRRVNFTNLFYSTYKHNRIRWIPRKLDTLLVLANKSGRRS